MAEPSGTRVVTIATPEGAAYYPFGSWGRGYILDASARAAMDTYLRRVIWIMMPIYPMSSYVGKTLGFDNLASAFGGWLVFTAIHTGVTLFILRNCKIAVARVTSEELLHLSIERRGHLAIESAWWGGLIVGACGIAVLGLTHAGLERWVAVGLGAIWTGFAALQLWRLKRLDAA